MTTLQPAASAGASFQQVIASGPFQGTMSTATPSGWWCVKQAYSPAAASVGAGVAPSSLVHQPAW